LAEESLRTGTLPGPEKYDGKCIEILGIQMSNIAMINLRNIATTVIILELIEN
jgi:hypothetical protein